MVFFFFPFLRRQAVSTKVKVSTNSSPKRAKQDGQRMDGGNVIEGAGERERMAKEEIKEANLLLAEKSPSSLRLVHKMGLGVGCG